MAGGTGNDAEDGASGDDTFLQDAAANGNDTLTGSFDTDTVSYADRAARVVVDIDGAADDGDPAAAEPDNVTATVENLDGRGGQRRPHGQRLPELADRQRGPGQSSSASTPTTSSTAARERTSRRATSAPTPPRTPPAHARSR